MIDLDDLLLFWRALAARRGDRAAAGGVVRPRADRRVPGRQRAAGGPRARRWARSAATVTAVGDDFQAIYGFRSASAAHILDFPAHFPGTRVVTLERNYRSDAAGAGRRERASPRRRRARSRSACARTAPGGVRPRVRPRARRGGAGRGGLRPRPRGARAGLGAARPGRADAHVARLRPAGARAHPPPRPVLKYGGLRYLEAAHVKDFVATAAPGRQRRRRRRLVPRAAARRGPRPGERAREAHRGDGAGEASARAPAAAARRSARARGRSAREVVPAGRATSADAVIAALRRRARGAAARAAGRGRCATCSRRWSGCAIPTARCACRTSISSSPRRTRRRDPRHFVAELVLDPPQSSADIAQPPHLDEDYLTLSTIHSAKGLEWDSVHVLAVYDGNFPACMARGHERADRRGAAAAVRRR